MIDTKRRSLAKALIWRAFAVCTLGTISVLTVEDLKAASLITLFYHSIQIGLFFIHERVWSLIKWGKSKGLVVQMTGLSGSGKSTLANVVQKILLLKGIQVEVLDGDHYKRNFGNNPNFSKEENEINIKRLGFVAKVLARNNVVVIIASTHSYEKLRKEVEVQTKSIKTIFLDCDLNTLEKRKLKGLYKKEQVVDNRKDKIHHFTGSSHPFEKPSICDLRIKTSKESIEESAFRLEKFIMESINFNVPKRKKES